MFKSYVVLLSTSYKFQVSSFQWTQNLKLETYKTSKAVEKDKNVKLEKKTVDRFSSHVLRFCLFSHLSNLHYCTLRYASIHYVFYCLFCFLCFIILRMFIYHFVQYNVVLTVCYSMPEYSCNMTSEQNNIPMLIF